MGKPGNGSGEGKNRTKSVEDDDNNVPYDRGWAWMVDLACFVLFLVYISHDHWHSVLLIDYLQEFDITVSLVTIMLSLGSICYCLATQISTNVLVTRFSIRVVTTLAAILNVVATLLFVAAPNLVNFFIANFIKFTVKGVTLIATLILVGHYFRRRRGLATTLGLLGVSSSYMCAPPLIRYLREEYGFRGCFLIMAGFEMHAIVAALLLRPISSYKPKKGHSDISSLEKDELNPLILQSVDERSQDLKVMVELSNQLPTQPADTSEIPVAEANLSDVKRDPFMDDEALKNKIDSLNDLSVEVKCKSRVSSDETNNNKENRDTQREEIDNKKLGSHELTGQDAGHVKEPILARQADDTNAKHSEIQLDGSLILAEEAVNKSNSQHSEKSYALNPGTNGKSYTSIQKELPDTSDHVNDTSPPSPNSPQAGVGRSFHTSNWSLVTASAMGSVLNITHVIDAVPADTDGQHHRRPHKCSWIKDLIDVSLLKNYLALMVAANYILVNSGAFSLVYLPSYAKRVGVSSTNAALLLSIVGAMDMVGRLSFGFLADLKFLRPNQIIAVTSLCIGTVTYFVVLFDGFEKLVFFSVVHGLLGGAGQNLTTVLIVDVVGIQYLAKLLSMSSMINSFYFVIQHPIQGAMIEVTGNFLTTYYFVGTTFILSTLLMFSEPLIRKLQVAKEKKSGLRQLSVETWAT